MSPGQSEADWTEAGTTGTEKEQLKLLLRM